MPIASHITMNEISETKDFGTRLKYLRNHSHHVEMSEAPAPFTPTSPPPSYSSLHHSDPPAYSLDPAPLSVDAMPPPRYSEENMRVSDHPGVTIGFGEDFAAEVEYWSHGRRQRVSVVSDKLGEDA